MPRQELLRVQDHLILCNAYIDEIYQEDNILILKEYTACKLSFRDIMYKGTTANQALIASDIDVLNKLRDFPTCPPSIYGVVNTLFQSSLVST
ncbi:hypothetical protein IWQ60_003690 [Tieghemiomyces parasiticus]|uniref:Uncharacterized protein n=1 Tax=Tieghemiomyces parasiticus TaxID=78921 RepID=A0A9W8AF46_9FUNG|nr:hypothetical protein IWQ60_003690 [Tieghemiomyces parasiticus]